MCRQNPIRVIIFLVTIYAPHDLLFLLLPLRREFSFLPLLVATETTLKLLEELCFGLLSLWSISLPSPLLTLPDLRAERLAELRDARSALAFAELWNFSYSCLTPAAVRLRLPFTVIQNLPMLSHLCLSNLLLHLLIFLLCFLFAHTVKNGFEDIGDMLFIHI